MANEELKTKPEKVKVESDEENPKRKTIFLSNPRNITNEDLESDDYNDLELDGEGKPQPLMGKNPKTNEIERVIEKVSISITPEFLVWLDVQKLKYGDLEMSRGELLKRMIYDHPKLKTQCVDNGAKLEGQLNTFCRSFSERPGHVVMRSFKAHKKFNYEKYEKGIKELIALCEEG